MWAFIQKKDCRNNFSHSDPHFRSFCSHTLRIYVGFIHILFDSMQCKAKQESELGDEMV